LFLFGGKEQHEHYAKPLFFLFSQKKGKWNENGKRMEREHIWEW